MLTSDSMANAIHDIGLFFATVNSLLLLFEHKLILQLFFLVVASEAILDALEWVHLLRGFGDCSTG